MQIPPKQIPPKIDNNTKKFVFTPEKSIHTQLSLMQFIPKPLVHHIMGYLYYDESDSIRFKARYKKMIAGVYVKQIIKYTMVGSGGTKELPRIGFTNTKLEFKGVEHKVGPHITTPFDPVGYHERSVMYKFCYRICRNCGDYWSISPSYNLPIFTPNYYQRPYCQCKRHTEYLCSLMLTPEEIKEIHERDARYQ